MPARPPIDIFISWFDSLKKVKANEGPAIGTIAASLVILERLKIDYDLDLDAHLAKGGVQIKGASGTAVASILLQFGEIRPFAKEGGRTNRGLLAEIRPLLEKLGLLKLERLPVDKRAEVLTTFQAYLVEKVKEFHNRQKLKLVFDPKNSTWQTIHQLIVNAQAQNKGGPVAQHLVGAKLELRFPSLRISNEPTSAADAPTKRGGDFEVNDTIFHITVAPMPAVFEKCNQNLLQGMKTYLLVPDSKLVGARQVAEELCRGLVAVESLESFISQNIEEIGFFSRSSLMPNLVKLFEIYNRRVDAVEIDKSLMIELPSNLKDD